MAESYEDDYRKARERLDESDQALSLALLPVRGILASIDESRRKFVTIDNSPHSHPFPARSNPSEVFQWPSAEEVSVALIRWQVARIDCENAWSLMGTSRPHDLEPPPEP
jgi:hypothetical protein